MVNFYTPVLSRQEAAGLETRSLVSRMFKGSFGALAAHLIDSGELSREDLDALKALIEARAEGEVMMDALNQFAGAWMPVFLLHMAGVSAFILLVWGINRAVRPDVRLCYGLWLLALVKVYVPPFLPAPWPAPPAPAPVPVAVAFTGPFADPPVVGGTASPTPALWIFLLWAISVLAFARVVLWKNFTFRRRLSGGRFSRRCKGAQSDWRVGCGRRRTGYAG